MGFGVWGGLQSIGNGCGIQMDRFSAQTEPYESIFDDVHDFDDFGIVFGGLTLLPEGPRTLRTCPEVTMKGHEAARSGSKRVRGVSGFVLEGPGPAWRGPGGFWAGGCPTAGTVENPSNLHRISMESAASRTPL